MSIIQIARMIWARRFLVLMVAACTIFGGFVVTRVAQPRYEARSRIMVNLLKRDPVTGESVNIKSIGPYLSTQVEILRDYNVTGRVVDQFGWLTDPGLISQYAGRNRTDTRDFRRWLSQRVADRTSARLNGTVFEITYSSGNPTEARVGAEALRKAFLDASLELRRKDAAQNASWYDQQADTARKAAEQAELTKAAAEREYGIVMQDQMDLDSNRLRALAGAQPIAPNTPVSSPAGMQLAELDAQISEASKNLGPNHPDMVALKAKRAAMAQAAQQEANRIASDRAAAQNAVSNALEEEKNKVISQRDKVERLRQLQSEVDLRREQYRRTAARAAELNLEAAVADTGMKELGVVVTPTKPAFPNKPLIMGGSAGLGIGLGVFLALLIELLSRRVRGVDDLESALDVPCVGVIGVPQERRLRLPRRLRRRERPETAIAA